MLNINDNATMFVKGFAQEVAYDRLIQPEECNGEFIAVITDLKTSGYVKITGATKDGNKWILACSDGEVRVLEQEPREARIIEYGILVKNFEESLFGPRFDPVFAAQYEVTARAIEDGAKEYCVTGYVAGKQIRTSTLAKFWVDSEGKKHALTVSGSHYIF